MLKVMIVIVALVIVSSCRAKKTTQEILKKDYAKINDYLVKTVKIDDPMLNMAVLKRLLQKESTKSSLLADKSLMNTLGFLGNYTTLYNNHELCNSQEGAQLMMLADSGLNDESKLKKPNYPISRIENIIKYYAFWNIQYCRFGQHWPKMNYAYMQYAYDAIDRHLVSKLANERDISRNMNEALGLLKTLKPSDGALARALKQFISMKFLLRPDYCDERGYKILLRNDLATRTNTHSASNVPERRVDEIFQYFAKKHEKLCQPIVRKTLARNLRKLDPLTYKIILGLTSSFYLTADEYPELIESLKRKEFNRDFTVAQIVERPSKLQSNMWSGMDNFHLFVREIDAAGLNSQKELGEVNNTYELFGPAQQEPLQEFVLIPCKKFLNVFDFLVEADEYGTNMNPDHCTDSGDNFSENLTYHMIRAGVQVCNHLIQSLEP